MARTPAKKTTVSIPKDLNAKLLANWKQADGLPTIMEAYQPVAVIKGQLPQQRESTALLVALNPKGQTFYGLFDDGHGNADVGVHDLSALGFPDHITAVDAYPHPVLVLSAMWMARDGVDYLNPPYEGKKGEAVDHGQA